MSAEKEAKWEARRLAIESVIASKRTQISVADEFGVTRQAVSGWVSKYRKTGKITGTRVQDPKPPKITRDDLLRLRKIVETRAPSDYRIESEDNRWHWVELRELVLLTHRRRAERKECMTWLKSWGVKDPDVSAARKKALRDEVPKMAPVNPSESEELRSMLDAYRQRADEAPDETPRNRDAEKRKRKQIDKRRKSNKQAKAQKRKQRKKKR